MTGPLPLLPIQSPLSLSLPPPIPPLPLPPSFPSPPTLAPPHPSSPSPSVVVTRIQAYGYYDDINKVLDFYIGLVPAETKEAAEKLVPAKRATLPKFLFKEKSSLMREKVAIS